MREPAWRLFASEYNASQHVLKGAEEKSPNYIITPMGARVNRLYITGVLTDVEEMGADGIRRRARVSDPTGIHTVFADSFNPETAAMIADMEIPSYVSIVGKARSYEPEEGMVYVSLRAESIKVIPIEIRNYWIIEASQSLALRIAAMKEAMTMETATIKKITELGYPRYIAKGITETLRCYREINVESYEPLIHEALEAVTENHQPEFGQNYQKEEESILELIKTKQGEDGVSWNSLVEEAGGLGIEKDVVEEVIIILMEKGLVYEPQLGRLRLV